MLVAVKTQLLSRNKREEQTESKASVHPPANKEPTAASTGRRFEQQTSAAIIGTLLSDLPSSLCFFLDSFVPLERSDSRLRSE